MAQILFQAVLEVTLMILITNAQVEQIIYNSHFDGQGDWEVDNLGNGLAWTNSGCNSIGDGKCLQQNGGNVLGTMDTLRGSTVEYILVLMRLATLNFKPNNKF